MTLPPFPSFQAPPPLEREDIIDYLANHRATFGWEVNMGNSDDQFVIPVANVGFVVIERVPEADARTWDVKGYVGSDTHRTVSPANNLATLEASIGTVVAYIARQANLQNVSWEAHPTSTRTYEGQEAQNYVRIVTLIGSSTVEAIYDAYFENRSFILLGIVHSFGVSFASGLRIIASDSKYKQGSLTSKLLKVYADPALGELGATAGEIRYLPYTRHKRRFILLSGGQSLHLGFSLNSFNITEVSSLEHSSPDHAFFDNDWVKADPIV